MVSSGINDDQQRLEVLQRRKEYNPAAAMVFMTAMVVYYAVQGRFEQEVTGEMRKFISDEMEVYDYGQDFGPDHVEWTWVALLGYKAPGISSRDTKVTYRGPDCILSHSLTFTAPEESRISWPRPNGRRQDLARSVPARGTSREMGASVCRCPL